jgi:hypothetical protein
MNIRSFSLVCFIAIASNASAQSADVTRSFSGQFIVHAARTSWPAIIPRDLVTNRSALELKPELLAVSAERIKQALWQELGATPEWRDTIHLSLRPARSANDLVDVRLERFRSTWGYRVEFPDVMERRNYVRSMAHLILLESANKKSGPSSAEIPDWLTEGMTQLLIETRGDELMLPPPRKAAGGMLFTPTINVSRQFDPRRAMRLQLKELQPLTVEELSWPTPAQLSGSDLGRYRLCAGFFLGELQQLPEGRANLRAFLGGLGRCLNWQLAFHQAFAREFPRPLDLEKWWSLQTALLDGRDPDRLWTFEASLSKLDELLQVQVGIRAAETNLPTSGIATLQSVIEEWSSLKQLNVIKSKIAELDNARMRMAEKAVPLLDGYRATLTTYYTKRVAPGAAFQSGRNGPSAVKQLTRETVRTLNALDRQRAELQTAEPAK